MTAATDQFPDVSRCVFHQWSPAHDGIEALLPLSALRESDPVAYQRALAKYEDTPERRRLRETVIPGLDRRWTEVVFLSPILPHAIWEAWGDARGRPLPPQRFWAIPARDIPPAVTVHRTRTRPGDPIDPAEVEDFDPIDHRASHTTTPENLRWITKLAAAGRRGAWFHGTPHVLTSGPVPLDGATLIDWSDGAGPP